MTVSINRADVRGNANIVELRRMLEEVAYFIHTRTMRPSIVREALANVAALVAASLMGIGAAEVMERFTLATMQRAYVRVEVR